MREHQRNQSQVKVIAVGLVYNQLGSWCKVPQLRKIACSGGIDRLGIVNGLVCASVAGQLAKLAGDIPHIAQLSDPANVRMGGQHLLDQGRSGAGKAAYKNGLRGNGRGAREPRKSLPRKHRHCSFHKSAVSSVRRGKNFGYVMVGALEMM